MHQLSRQIIRVPSREKGGRPRCLAFARLLSSPLMCHEPRKRGRSVAKSDLTLPNGNNTQTRQICGCCRKPISTRWRDACAR
jgi:hypothetical protein